VGATIERIRGELGTAQLADAGLKISDLALATLRDQLGSRGAQARADEILDQIDQMLRNRQASEKAVDKTAIFIDKGRPISGAAPTGEYAGQ
jgi:hypothetical protein